MSSGEHIFSVKKNSAIVNNNLCKKHYNADFTTIFLYNSAIF